MLIFITSCSRTHLEGFGTLLCAVQAHHFASSCGASASLPTSTQARRKSDHWVIVPSGRPQPPNPVRISVGISHGEIFLRDDPPSEYSRPRRAAGSMAHLGHQHCGACDEARGFISHRDADCVVGSKQRLGQRGLFRPTSTEYAMLGKASARLPESDSYTT